MKYLLVFFLATIALLFSFEEGHAQQKNLQSVNRQIEAEFRQQKLTLDQKILYQFYALYQSSELPTRLNITSTIPNTRPVKCGTPLAIEAYEHRNELSASTRRKIKALQKSNASNLNQTYLSPSGKFTIRYTTSGKNAVPPKDNNQNGTPDYVEEVGAAADSSYHYEVQTLGYTDPIPEGKTYEIQVLDVERFYGQTVPENGTTIMQIENDFSENFPSNDDPDNNRLGDIKVTVAHEFKHAIQFVDNGFSGETDDWAEMDAVRMEEVVYDKVNDYYNYLNTENSIFFSPARSFYPASYYQVTWALYFEQKYGHQFWVNVWDEIHKNPDITMVHAITQQLDDAEEFYRNFTESEIWHYTSGNNTFMNYGFDEADAYPSPAISHTLPSQTKMNASLTLTDTIPGFAANYDEFTPNQSKEGNLRIDVRSNNSMSGIGILVRFKDGGYGVDTTLTLIQNSSFSNQTIRTGWKWNDIQKVSVVVANASRDTSAGYSLHFYSEVPPEIKLSQNYPNPFSPADGTTITYKLQSATHVQLKVYDISGRLIAILVDEDQSSGQHTVSFKGSNLSSGVYIYQLVTDKHASAKKMTLIR